MKKLMVLGAGYTQIPLILAAKALGYRVAVASIPGNYPGFAYGDEKIYVDISDPEAVADKAEEAGVHGVATCGLDLAMRSIGAVCERMRLPGPSRAAAEKAGNKLLMKQALSKAGVLTAPWICVRNIGELEHALDSLRFPVIVKAVDLMGSRGIFRCDTAEEARRNYKKTMEATRQDYCLVEEFMEGTLFGVEGMIREGEIQFLLPNNTEAFQGAVPSPIGHSVPFAQEASVGRQARKEAEKAIRALGLDNCPVNCDFILKDGRTYVVELTGRSGATGLSEMVGTWYGINYYETIVKLAMGCEVKDDFSKENHTPNLSRTLLSMRSGRLVRLENRNPVDEDILELSFNAEPGEKICAYTNGRDRIGQVMLKGRNLQEIREKLDRVLGNIYMELEGDISLPETVIQRAGRELEENELFIKREDLLPFSFGGNKVRFARYYLEDMERCGGNAMIIYGNYHSNLCRILSAACRRRGIPCSLIHNVDDVDPAKLTGNRFLIGSMGVKEYPCHKGEIAPCVARARKDFEDRGYRPYYIYGDDLGKGNASVPMEAYAAVYQEILRQEKALHTHFDMIFVASSTNTTQSGLLAGMLLAKDHRDLVGISVTRGAERAGEVILANLKEYFEKAGKQFTQAEWKEISGDIIVADEYLAGGYGRYDAEIAETIRQVYEQEGIPLDGTYTGKAFYGMKEYLKSRNIKGKRILFLHTGGAPLFFDSIREIFGSR